MGFRVGKPIFWNGERQRRCERMWSEGRTFEYIALRLGATRSSVSGLVHRKGFKRFAEAIVLREQEERVEEIGARVTEPTNINWPPTFPLCLPKPGPNSERLAPDQIPTDARAFGAWIHFACTEWPTYLMATSYHASEEIRRGVPDDAFREFRSLYSEWWRLSEATKDKTLHSCQVLSPRRVYYRRQAFEAAAGRIKVLR